MYVQEHMDTYYLFSLLSFPKFELVLRYFIEELHNKTGGYAFRAMTSAKFPDGGF